MSIKFSENKLVKFPKTDASCKKEEPPINYFFNPALHAQGGLEC